MKMHAGFLIPAILLASCATTTSDWAVLDASQSNRVELVSQSGVRGNDAKARQTALRTCESRGYARTIELDDRAIRNAQPDCGFRCARCVGHAAAMDATDRGEVAAAAMAGKRGAGCQQPLQRPFVQRVA